jgi:hypothetical protein
LSGTKKNKGMCGAQMPSTQVKRTYKRFYKEVT